MITFEKQENGVLFTFENSDKYLYGDGTILVPFNSLAVIQDESDMITLRKSASWDIFLSGRYDTDFNYGSKAAAVDALKEALFDETGGGVTEEEVEQMIEEATSGIPSSQVIEQLRTDVNAISGEVNTLQDDVASKADASALTAVNDVLTGHTANTTVHVTSADKSAWDAKQDALTAGENITISGNVISAEAGNNIIELTQEEYDALVDKDPDALYIITDAQEINMNNYATKTDLNSKADASALTAVSDAVSGKADTSYVNAALGDKADNTTVTALSGQVATKVETSDFNAFSAATDARIATDEEVTAAALNDLAETVSGKQDTLISGGNIKTINNISILGEGNITISGGGGGDYQYYTEDTTNESATIEVEHQSLSVDGNGVYVNGDPVVTEGALREYVTAEDLDDNYYTIDEVDAGFESIYDEIDTKEEVIASALTELNLRLDEDEEVTAAALNDLDEKISTAGGLFVNFDDLMENMNDDKWDELVNAIQDNKPIFAIYNGSEGDITADIEQFPVDAYVYIDETEGEEQSIITLNRLYIGGYNSLIITKFDSEDYEVTDDGGDYQYMLQAGYGISIDENNVISVAVDSELDETSNNPVANSAITNAIINNEYTVSQAINSLNNRLVEVESGGSSVTVDDALNSGSTNPVANSAITTAMNAKQDALSAGTGISISNNVISTSGVVMSQTVTQLVKLTQAAYDALATKDSNTLYIISD